MERMVDLRVMDLDQMREHVAQLLRVNRQLIEENRRLKAQLEEIEKRRRRFQLASKVGLFTFPIFLILGIALAKL